MNGKALISQNLSPEGQEFVRRKPTRWKISMVLYSDVCFQPDAVGIADIGTLDGPLAEIVAMLPAHERAEIYMDEFIPGGMGIQIIRRNGSSIFLDPVIEVKS